jgi:hypothetical protein
MRKDQVDSNGSCCHPRLHLGYLGAGAGRRGGDTGGLLDAGTCGTEASFAACGAAWTIVSILGTRISPIVKPATIKQRLIRLAFMYVLISIPGLILTHDCTETQP